MKLFNRLENKIGNIGNKSNLGLKSLKNFFTHQEGEIQPITISELEKIKFLHGGGSDDSRSVASFFQSYSKVCVSPKAIDSITVGKTGVITNNIPSEYATFFYEVNKPDQSGEMYKEIYVLDIDKMGNRIGYCTMTYNIRTYDYPYIFFTKNYDQFQGKGYNYYRYLNAKKISERLFPDKKLGLSVTIADPRSLKAAEKLVEQGLMKKSMISGKDRYQFI